MRLLFSILVAVLAVSRAQAHLEDDPLLYKVLIEELEWQPEHSGGLAWDAQAWVGHDLQKLWLKTEGERGEQGTEAASAQLLYGYGVAPYWDLQFGVRREFAPGSDRNQLAVALQGLAPYFVETEVSAFVDEQGEVAVLLEFERELLITQKLILAPDLELTLFSDDDAQRMRGSGIATVEAGLRLRYEVVREFAPYVGLSWEKAYGATADARRLAEEPAEETQWVIGIRAWF